MTRRDTSRRSRSTRSLTGVPSPRIASPAELANSFWRNMLTGVPSVAIGIGRSGSKPGHDAEADSGRHFVGRHLRGEVGGHRPGRGQPLTDFVASFARRLFEVGRSAVLGP